MRMQVILSASSSSDCVRDTSHLSLSVLIRVYAGNQQYILLRIPTLFRKAESLGYCAQANMASCQMRIPISSARSYRASFWYRPPPQIRSMFMLASTASSRSWRYSEAEFWEWKTCRGMRFAPARLQSFTHFPGCVFLFPMMIDYFIDIAFATTPVCLGEYTIAKHLKE